MSSAKKIALLIVLVLLYWGFHSIPAIRVQKNDLPIQARVTIGPVSSSTPTPVTEAAEKNTSSGNQVAIPPSVSDLREEIKQDVHVTPPSLLRFGADLGVRMQEAKRNKTQAIALLGELKTCANPAQIEESPVQARALCLVSAQELGQTWPELQDEVEALLKSSDPQATQLASKLQKND